MGFLAEETDKSVKSVDFATIESQLRSVFDDLVSKKQVGELPTGTPTPIDVPMPVSDALSELERAAKMEAPMSTVVKPMGGDAEAISGQEFIKETTGNTPKIVEWSSPDTSFVGFLSHNKVLVVGVAAVGIFAGILAARKMAKK